MQSTSWSCWGEVPRVAGASAVSWSLLLHRMSGEGGREVSSTGLPILSSSGLPTFWSSGLETLLSSGLGAPLSTGLIWVHH
jgi:hypothetical protein